MAYVDRIKKRLGVLKDQEPEYHKILLESLTVLERMGVWGEVLADSEERLLRIVEPEGVTADDLQNAASQHRAIRELVLEFKSLMNE